jgi:hypothetical protein
MDMGSSNRSSWVYKGAPSRDCASVFCETYETNFNYSVNDWIESSRFEIQNHKPRLDIMGPIPRHQFTDC